MYNELSKKCFILKSYNSQIHYNDGIMSAMASQITSLTIVYSTANSGTDRRKHHSSASLTFVRAITHNIYWGITNGPYSANHILHTLLERRHFYFNSHFTDFFIKLSICDPVHLRIRSWKLKYFYFYLCTMLNKGKKTPHTYNLVLLVKSQTRQGSKTYR